MDRKAQVLTLLVFVLITSGCIDNEDDTESIGSEAINLHELSVQPSEIYSGSSTNVILHISNSGELPADLSINSDGGSYGDKVLTDRCRDFLDVEDFTVSGPGNEDNSENYTVPPRDEVRFTWSLRNPESSTVPLTGHECNLKFQVPFDYSVNAYRQLQFKESREASGAEGLGSQSSQGPMMLNIETVGSTADQSSTFIEGDNAEVMISLINQGEEGTSYTGFIEASVPEIDAEGLELEDGCGEDIDEDSLTMYEGESQTIRCEINVDGEIDGSIRGEVTASSNYTYVQNLGSETVEVQYRGN